MVFSTLLFFFSSLRLSNIMSSCAVNIHLNILVVHWKNQQVLLMSSPAGGVIFPWLSVRLYITNRARSITLETFKILSRNFVQIYSRIRQCAENKYRNFTYSFLRIIPLCNFSMEIVSAPLLFNPLRYIRKT